MSGLRDRIARLSEQEKELLHAILEERGVDLQAILVRRRRMAGPMPLSFTQKRLWTVGQLVSAGAFGNVPVAFRIRGPLDVERLDRSFGDVVRRHAILRTTFPAVDGVPVQRSRPEPESKLRLVDLSDLPESERSEAGEKCAAEEALRAFDLVRESPCRLVVVRSGPDEHIVMILLHHLAADGWGIRLLLRELAAHYGARAEEREPDVPVIRMQYDEFALWQREALRGRDLEAQLDHLEEQLRNAPSVLDLSALRTGDPSLGFSTAIQRFELSAGLAEGLRALARREHVTLYMALLALFQALLHLRAGVDDVIVGSIISNRPRREAEDLIGNFGNNVLLRTDFSDDPPYRDLLSRVRETVLSAQEHPDVPLEMLVERRGVRVPRFHLMFILRDSPLAPNLALSGLDVEALHLDVGVSPLELNLDLADGPAGLSGGLEYRTGLFSRETVAGLIDDFRSCLGEAVEDPDRRVSQWKIRRARRAATTSSGADGAEHATSTGGSGGGEAPSTEMEIRIAAAWREILGEEEISVFDNFFDLGGHSLLAMAAIERIERKTGYRLTAVDLGMQTLGQLAAMCAGAKSGLSA